MSFGLRRGSNEKRDKPEVKEKSSQYSSRAASRATFQLHDLRIVHAFFLSHSCFRSHRRKKRAPAVVSSVL